MAVIKATFTTMGQQSRASIAAGAGWYRYGGSKPEQADPAEPLPQNRNASAAKRARLAEYTRLRLDGKTKDEAAQEIRVKASTASYYEREFRDEHPEAAP